MWHATLPKTGKSLLVANLALALAVGGDHAGFQVPSPKRVLICQFELPTPQFALRLATMRKAVGDSYLLLARPSPQIPTVELRFQFRYAAAPPSRFLSLDDWP